jgi:hypothetical protein
MSFNDLRDIPATSLFSTRILAIAHFLSLEPRLKNYSTEKFREIMFQSKNRDLVKDASRGGTYCG